MPKARNNRKNTNSPVVTTENTEKSARKGRKPLAIEDRKHVIPVGNLAMVAWARDFILAHAPEYPARPEMPEIADDATGATIRDEMTAYARALAAYPDAVAAWESENSDAVAFLAALDAARPVAKIATEEDASDDASDDSGDVVAVA